MAPPLFGLSLLLFAVVRTVCIHRPRILVTWGGAVIFKASVRVIIHKINSDWFVCVLGVVLGVVYASLTHDLLPTSMY